MSRHLQRVDQCPDLLVLSCFGPHWTNPIFELFGEEHVTHVHVYRKDLWKEARLQYGTRWLDHPHLATISFA